MKSKIKIFNIILITLLFSCKPKADLSYLKNIEETAILTSKENYNNTIQKGDQLVILVSARDMDVVKPFNKNYSSASVNQYTLPNSNVLAQNQTSTEGPIYIVDSNNEIEFNIIGKINTSGKTIENLKDELITRLRKYIINPIVTIRNANYKVTVLGEVSRAGQYIIPEGETTLLNALGLAGDLTIYGRRDNILIVRNIDGEITKGRVDLSDANFMNSPFYQLKQNDVVMVSPNQTREKTSRLDPNAGIYISVASVILGLLGLIFRK